MLVAGIDGTKRGWVVVTFDGASTSCWGVATLSEAMSRLRDAAAIGIDIPIGFPEGAERGGRECERCARNITRSHPSSIFSSPVRAALAHSEYRDACDANRRSSFLALGISKQAHALFPKMLEADRLFPSEDQTRVFEVHPELSFSQMLVDSSSANSRLPSKKTAHGQTLRRDLLRGVGFRDIDAILGKGGTERAGAKADDILDAYAAAWTAKRRCQGVALRLPTDPVLDSRGLRMEIWA